MWIGFWTFGVLTLGQYIWVEIIKRKIVSEINELEAAIEANGNAVIELNTTMKRLADDFEKVTSEAAEQAKTMRGGHDPRELQELGVEARMSKKADKAAMNKQFVIGQLAKMVGGNVPFAKWIWEDSGLVDNDVQKLIADMSRSGITQWFSAWQSDNAGAVQQVLAKAKTTKNSDSSSSSHVPPPY